MYHRIGIDPNPSLERYCVHPEMFARQMTYLRRRGFAAMTFAQLAEAKKVGRPLTGRPIVISFDDAHEMTWHVMRGLFLSAMGSSLRYSR